ncbi:MAG: IS66 family transposase [Rickettsiales bacterium]
MKTNTAYQEKSKNELLALLAEKDSHITQQSQQINALTEMLRIYRYRQFGNKSEKMPLEQLSIFNEAELPKNVEAIIEADEEIHVTPHTRKKSPGRKPLPAELPREQRIHDLPEEEKTCACGEKLTHIKDETCEQLDIIPAKVYVIQHVKRKYACRSCEDTIKTARMPAQPIPRSIASPGLLSHVFVSKFEDHLPLHRQEQMLRRIGIDIPRATLCLWVVRGAELFKPMMKLIHKNIIGYDVAYSDETTVQVLKDPNKGVTNKKYMWLFAGGRPDKFAYYYHYHHSRSHDVPLNFFEGYKGHIHCDGFQGYDALAAKSSDIILSGCMYHARRKFFEITKITRAKEGVAHDVLKFITLLARIEEEIKELSHEDKYRIRLEKAKPVLDDLYAYLSAVHPRVLPKSPLGQAVSYTLNQWPKLTAYLADGRLENSNNRSERAIKPFVIGRKGWMFADSVAGAEAAAVLFSLVETCKHHDIEAYDWFRYVLQKIPLCQSDDEIEALLPFNIDRSLLVRV